MLSETDYDIGLLIYVLTSPRSFFFFFFFQLGNCMGKDNSPKRPPHISRTYHYLIFSLFYVLYLMFQTFQG